MKKGIIITSTVLALSCSATFAAPVAHYHGDRLHSHNLPGIGMAHTHGGLPASRVAKQSQPQRQAQRPAKRLIPMSALMPHQKKKVLALAKHWWFSYFKTNYSKA